MFNFFTFSLLRSAGGSCSSSRVAANFSFVANCSRGTLSPSSFVSSSSESSELRSDEQSETSGFAGGGISRPYTRNCQSYALNPKRGTMDAGLDGGAPLVACKPTSSQKALLRFVEISMVSFNPNSRNPCDKTPRAEAYKASVRALGTSPWMYTQVKLHACALIHY